MLDASELSAVRLYCDKRNLQKLRNAKTLRCASTFLFIGLLNLSMCYKSVLTVSYTSRNKGCKICQPPLCSSFRLCLKNRGYPHLVLTPNSSPFSFFLSRIIHFHSPNIFARSYSTPRLLIRERLLYSITLRKVIMRRYLVLLGLAVK